MIETQIYRGANFAVTFHVTADHKPVYVSNAVTAGLRPHPRSGRYVAFAVNVANPWITLSLNAAQTAKINAGTYQFDVFDGSEHLLTGTVRVKGTVQP